MCVHAVLSWGGEDSVISKDAIEDAQFAKNSTVIDEWDEDFDSGKVRRHNGQHNASTSHVCTHNLMSVLLLQVKKIKKYKKEKRKRGNAFQKIQDHRSMWSVTPGGKRSRLGFRQ